MAYKRKTRDEYTMNEIERYRNAVAEKSRAQEYRRTAVQHCDIYRAIHRLEYWTKEVEAAYADLPREMKS